MNTGNDKPILATIPESFDSYHQRNCKICRHPDRPAIEYDFLHWRSPDFIAREYDLTSRSIYRHAHAVGLYDHRRRNLRSSLEFIIEDASRTPATAEAVVRAVQLYARITDTGELIEVPKTQVIVIARDAVPAAVSGVLGAKIGGGILEGAKINQNVSVSAQLSPANTSLSPDPLPSARLSQDTPQELSQESPQDPASPAFLQASIESPAPFFESQPVTPSQTEIELSR